MKIMIHSIMRTVLLYIRRYKSEMKLNTKSIAIREYTGELQKSKANGDLISRFFLSFDIWNETTGLSRIRSMPNCARRIH